MISGGPTLLRMPAVALAVLLLALPGGDVRAQDCLDYSAQAVWVGAMAGAAPVFKVIDVMESGLLVGATADSALVACSLADPAHPAFLSAMDLGKVYSDLDCSGEYVYLCGASSSGVRIVRVAADGSLSDEGVLHAGLTVSDLDVDGELLGMCLGDSWQLWDCSASAVPQLVSTINDGAQYTRISLEGHSAATTHAIEGLRLFDLSVPGSPVLLGSGFPGYDHCEYGSSTCFVVLAGQRAYLTVSGWAYNGGGGSGTSFLYSVSILDISDPSNITSLWTTSADGIRLFRVDNRILVGSVNPDGTMFLDVDAPDNAAPLYVPCRRVLGGVGEHVYTDMDGGGLRAWRVPPAMPSVIYPASDSWENHDIGDIDYGYILHAAVSGGMYVAEAYSYFYYGGHYTDYYEQIAIMSPEIGLIATLPANNPRCMVFDGPRLYYLEADLLRCVDASDSESFSHPLVFDVGGWPTCLEVLGDSMVAIGVRGQIEIYDVADFANSLLVSTVSRPATCLKLDGTILLVGADEEVCLVDIQDPAAPVVRGSCLVGDAEIMTVLGGSSVLIKTLDSIFSDPIGRCVLVDYSSPLHPRIVAARSFPFNMEDLAVSGGFIYMPGMGLNVADATDLTHVGSIASTHSIEGLVSQGGQLFSVAVDSLLPVSEHCGTQVPVRLSSVRLVLHDGLPVLSWSLSRPTGNEYFSVQGDCAGSIWEVPVRMLNYGAYEARDTSPSAAIPGEATYNLYEIAGSTRTLLASEHLVLSGLSQTLRLSPVTPNPFNPRTTVVFELPRPGRADLSVYDAAGRLVRRLAAGDLPAGSHTAAWDGRDDRGGEAPSGAYFLRLSGESGSVSRKAVLLR